MSGPQHPPTEPEYIYSTTSSNTDRVEELERRVELLGRCLDHVCNHLGMDLRELIEYEEELDRKNEEVAKQSKNG